MSEEDEQLVRRNTTKLTAVEISKSQSPNPSLYHGKHQAELTGNQTGNRCTIAPAEFFI
jgi:hypothetical protein